MLFNSYVFLFAFLPITWGLFRLACRYKVPDLAIGILTGASLVFYSWWNPPFVILIIFSVLFNYETGRVIEKNQSCGKRAKAVTALGIGINLLLIGYFKYSDFFMENALGLFGKTWTPRGIFLPLGISFFTFQQIAYLIDCYKGLAKGHPFLHYALFVTFFPQLIAGPIVRYDQIMPYFRKLKTFAVSYKNLAMGMTLLALGLFKKLVIADTLSPWVAAVFDESWNITFFEAWASALSYTFQIYFDFSGYSDMAMGLGLLFNIPLPLNFDSPYKSLSIVEFWRRWHISLSTFLRDYLYIPLGGSRKGEFRRYINLGVTMLLGGLWHGASWNFVVWGGLHGLFLGINHLFRSLHPKALKGPVTAFFSWALTFISVTAAWVFFRAESLGKALYILKSMAGLNGVILPPNYVPIQALRNFLEKLGVEFIWPETWQIFGYRELLFLPFCMTVAFSLPNACAWTKGLFQSKDFKVSWALAVGVVLALSVCFLDRTSEFLYFQF